MLPIKSFSEIEQLYLFDMKLKSTLYPWLMRLETSIKNNVLESICDSLREQKLPATYDAVCKSCLTSGSAKERYETRARLSAKIAENCNKKDVLSHFTANSREVPIWALMETLSLGEFVRIYKHLSTDIKDDVYSKLGLPPRTWDGSKGSKEDTTDHLSAILFAITDLRNCIAHNGIIIDARFSVRNHPSEATRQYLVEEYGLPQIQFKDLADYLLMIVLLLTDLGYSKTDRKQLVSAYASVMEEFSSPKLSQSILTPVVGKAYRIKIKAAFSYIREH